MDLLGDEAFDTEDDMLNCWAESMKDVDCKTALITYEDFILLMKGQNRDKTNLRKSIHLEPLEMQQDLLSPVPEIEFEMDEETNESVNPTITFLKFMFMPLNLYGLYYQYY